MGREMLKTPEWWSWPAIWSATIKERRGWTDEDLAKRLGITSRQLYRVKKEAYKGSGRHILRLLAMYKEVTQNAASR